MHAEYADLFKGSVIMYIIDRIEEGLAVIYDDDSKIIDVMADEIKGNAREGAVLVKGENGFIVDEEETQKRFDNARKRLDKLFGR